MKVAIAGGSGLVGSALAPFLRSAGHEVKLLQRNQDYLPVSGYVRERLFDGVQVFINLAGAPIGKRWSPEVKNEIEASRVNTTMLFNQCFRSMQEPPLIWINASAIGYYGSRGDQTLDETSAPGTGFLSEVTQAWEAALPPSVKGKMRVTALRFGLILSSKGGAFAQMLTPFKFGLGGVLGDGKQFMSWVSIEDVLGSIYHVMNTEALNGPINVVAPHPVRNQEFTSTLGKVLHRPTFLRLPPSFLHWVGGEMSDELLLASTKVEPKRLLESGYPFLFPTLEPALKNCLKPSGSFYGL